jgi:hypothetical protein
MAQRGDPSQATRTVPARCPGLRNWRSSAANLTSASGPPTLLSCPARTHPSPSRTPQRPACDDGHPEPLTGRLRRAVAAYRLCR